MAKISSSTVGKAQGANKTVNSSQSGVLAERNGKQRIFSRLIWDQLPPAKEGWKEVVESPSEPKKKSQPKSEDTKKSKSDKPKTEGKTKASGKTIEHVLTEEDFEKNPELEAQGLKVGDTIEIEDGDKN